MNLCEKSGVSANVHRVFCLAESDMFFAEAKKDFFASILWPAKQHEADEERKQNSSQEKGRENGEFKGGFQARQSL